MTHILARSTVVPRFNQRPLALYTLSYQGRELPLRLRCYGQSPCLTLAAHVGHLRLELRGLGTHAAPRDYETWLYFRMETLHLDAYTDSRAIAHVRAFYGLTLPHYLDLLRIQNDFCALLGADYAAFVAGDLVCECA